MVKTTILFFFVKENVIVSFFQGRPMSQDDEAHLKICDTLFEYRCHQYAMPKGKDIFIITTLGFLKILVSLWQKCRKAIEAQRHNVAQ